MAEYKQRIADRILERKVLGKGAVLIEGPKWCGKTTTAKQLAKSVLDLGNASVLKQSSQMIEISPKSLLEGATPRLMTNGKPCHLFGIPYEVRWINVVSRRSLSLQAHLYFLMRTKPSIAEQEGMPM